MSSPVQKTKPDMNEGRDEELYQSLRLMLFEIRTHSPFFGVLASELWIAGPAANVPTIGVSPKGVIFYNEGFMNSLTPGERVACIVHEALHVALEYWDIFPGKRFNPKIANWAHDYSINDIIEKSLVGLRITRQSTGKVIDLGIKLPKGTLWDAKYTNWTTQAVYADLMEGVNKKKDAILAQLGSNAEASKERERENKINKELRDSLIQGKKLVDKKVSEAMARAGYSDPVAKANREIVEALKDSAGIEFDHTILDEENGVDRSSVLGEVEGEQEQPKISAQGNPVFDSDYLRKKEAMQKNCMEAFGDYMGKEKERIVGEVDGTPNGSTRADHLQGLSDDLDEISDEYIEDVTNPKESSPEQGNDPSDQNGEPDQEQEGGEPGQEGGEPGQDGDSDPNASPENQSGDQQDNESAEPGNQQDQGNPQSGNGSSSSDPSGQPQGGQGDPSDPQSGEPQSGGGEGVSEREAVNDVRDALRDMSDQLSDALNGKDNDTGLDKDMASGEDMTSQGAMEEAMRQMAEEIGAGEFDGDVDFDCSEVEGNPFGKETPEETKERHKETLSRAVREDIQAGGDGMGSMPAWAKTAINDIVNPPLRFNQKIKRFIGNLGPKSRRSFAVRNKRNSFQPNSMLRPGMKSNSAKIYILMDTSGSMMQGQDLENLKTALGLINRLALSEKMEVEVVQADTEVTRIMNGKEALDEIRKRDFEIKGMGGSSLNKSFDYIWKDMDETNQGRGNPVIVFTDGAIQVPAEEPRHIRQQVLWVTAPGQSAPTNKWGQHVLMNDPSP